MHIKGNLLSMGDKSSFLFRGWGERDFWLFFSLVLNVFPSCSQSVPKYIPQDITNSTWVLSHMVSPKFTPMYINQKGEIYGNKFYYILQIGVQRDASNGGTPNVPQKIVDGPINMAPSKKKEKSCECAHDLINMNHKNGKATTRPIKRFDQSTTRFRSQP